jgi:hypothetical protein
LKRLRIDLFGNNRSSPLVFELRKRYIELAIVRQPLYSLVNRRARAKYDEHKGNRHVEHPASEWRPFPIKFSSSQKKLSIQEVNMRGTKRL